jgi:hypothetical protein
MSKLLWRLEGGFLKIINEAAWKLMRGRARDDFKKEE